MDGTLNTPPPTARRRTLAMLWALPAAAALAAAALAAGQAKSAPVVDAHSEGLVCASNSDANHNAVFTLTAKRGAISTPDGNQMPMWGYALGDGAYQYPSPFLCVRQGDKVTIVLHNRLGNGEPTSITFPGQTGVVANGVPAEPDVANGSLTTPVADGQTVTYSFTASRAGSFLYVSGTYQGMQKQMGLFGGLVVRSAADGGGHVYAYDNTNPSAKNEYDPAHEYAQMLSNVDPDLHRLIDNNPAQEATYDWTKFRVRYWFINGRSMPDTIAPNHASWLPAQPYSSFVHVQADSPLPALIRYFNASDRTHPFHPHGADTNVLGIDGQPLRGAGNADMSIRKYLIEIAPGQTVDATWAYRSDRVVYDASKPPNPNGATLPNSGWTPQMAASNGIPLPDFRDVRYTGENVWYGGTPYLGETAPLPQEHHLVQPVRRVLHGRPQPRPERGHHLRHGDGRHAHALPHRPERRVPGMTTTPSRTGDTTVNTNRMRARTRLAAVVATMVAAAVGSAPASADVLTPNCTGTPASMACELWAKPSQMTVDSTAVNTWVFTSNNSTVNPAIAGSTLVVTAGDVVTITVHNDTPTPLRFSVPQQVTPDSAPIATGDSGSVTFTATAGTSLYEAGPGTDAARRQIAMGLYGALVVLPSPATVPPHAYASSSSVYNDEKVLVLSDLDPLFNNAMAAPDWNADIHASVDHTHYYLVNGQLGTQPLAVDPLTPNVLLRYLNAGMDEHSMSILGLRQTHIAQDGVERAAPQDAAVEKVPSGATADDIVDVSTLVAGQQIPVYDTGRAAEGDGMGVPCSRSPARPLRARPTRSRRPT